MVGPCVPTITRQWCAQRFSPPRLGAQQPRTLHRPSAASRDWVLSSPKDRPRKREGPRERNWRSRCEGFPAGGHQNGGSFRHIMPTKKSKFGQTSGVSVMNLSTKPLRSQRLTKNTAEPASSIGNSPYLPTPAPSIQKACRERLATALKLAGSDLCKTALYTARRRPRRDRRIKNGGVRMRVTKSASYLEFYSF